VVSSYSILKLLGLLMSVTSFEVLSFFFLNIVLKLRQMLPSSLKYGFPRQYVVTG
jgi:hypothetical protein